MNTPVVAKLLQSSARFFDWYEGSLANRVKLKTQLLVTMLLIGFATLTYPQLFSLVQESASQRLEAMAILTSQRIESDLDRLLIETEKLSRRTLVANGLADSVGSQVYLRPYLLEHRQGFPELLSLQLLDALGQVVASAEQRPPVAKNALQSVMSHEKAVFELMSEGNRVVLHGAYPVRYQATGFTEGALAMEVDLSQLAGRVINTMHNPESLPLVVVLQDAGGRQIFSNAPAGDGDWLMVEQILHGVLAEKGFPLKLTVRLPKNVAYAPLLKMKMVAAVVALVTLLIALYLSRQISESVVRPLSEMSHHAMEIAGAGPSGLSQLPVTRRDEIGWMGTAFNEMVFSLRQIYENQEATVLLRTEELASTQARLASVLANIDDVIYSMPIDFSLVSYISPASTKIFGHPPSAFLENPGFFEQQVSLADVERLLEARHNLSAEGETELRYRIVRPDGAERWVLDRFHQVMDANGSPSGVAGVIQDVTSTVEAEASLRLRERALASSSCGVVIVDMLYAHQPILYVNDAFERITGYSAAEVIGKNCGMLQGGRHEDQGFALGQMRQAIRNGESCKVVLRNYRKNGQMFWNELQLSPLLDDSGRITHYIGIQNDISASIEGTQALVESENRLALTIDALHEGIWDWNMVNDSLITSPSWAAVLGLDPADYVGAHPLSSFTDHLPDEWHDRLFAAIRRHIDGEAEDYELEHEMIRGDGRRIWVTSHGRVVERGAGGQPLRMVGSIVDVTQRVEASDRIIALMGQLDVILTLTPDGIAYFNNDGVVSFINRAFEQLTGIKAGEASGLSSRDFIALLRSRVDPAQGFPDLLNLHHETGEERHLIHIQQPRQRVLQVSWHSPSEGSSVVVYLRDVTRETEVDRMKSEFLSTAAHELRTPMASIMGFAELLMLRDFGPERTRDMLGTINRQAKRLTDLINELLDLARIEARAGKDFKITPYPLVPVINDAIAALNVDGDRGRMQFVEPALQPVVPIDPAKLQQAIINILSNAYKYSPNGGPIEISVSRRTQGGGEQIGVVVRDHGMGMTPEQSDRLFERFFRADPSGNIPGTGLGMSLVKEIMDALHGSVSVDSQFGQGTTITLWLPLDSAVAPVQEVSTKQPKAYGELTLWQDDAPVETAE